MFENNATTTFNNLKNNLNMEISLDKINCVSNSIRKVIIFYI